MIKLKNDKMEILFDKMVAIKIKYNAKFPGIVKVNKKFRISPTCLIFAQKIKTL